ncbi:AraC family ligand binding domain-containing protein [Lysinibacillus sp. NPDC096418]|uniref:AraC family ligand binding domain-containing protein n=1 Tax=Lysinibacillus sp. NPDC096418 TaxID=3364138 RepID=UPI003826835E
MELVHIENELNDKAKIIRKVFSHDKMDIVTIQLRADEKIATHDAPNTVVIVVRVGEVIFTVNEMEHTLTSNDVMVIEPFEKHSLSAVSDTEIVLLKAF